MVSGGFLQRNGTASSERIIGLGSLGMDIIQMTMMKIPQRIRHRSHQRVSRLRSGEVLIYSKKIDFIFQEIKQRMVILCCPLEANEITAGHPANCVLVLFFLTKFTERIGFII